MIFVTIGSMFPFDRLVQAMDAWAAAHPDEEVFAQIGAGAEPQHMTWVRKLDRAAYGAAVTRADVVVAHAGMGTVLTAAEFGKPLILLPRRGALREHTNDHQMDTLDWLRTRPGIHVALDETALPDCLAVARAEAGQGLQTIGRAAPEAFLARIRAFVQS